MSDVFSFLIKLINNEPLERLMFIMLIFALVLICAPVDASAFINDKIGIPYAYQVVVFAMSFVLVTNSKRLYLFIREELVSMAKTKKEKDIICNISKAIDSFNEEQFLLMRTAISTQDKIINSSRDDLDIIKLVECGALIPDAEQDFDYEESSSKLHISPNFWKVMMYRWNGYTGKFDPINHNRPT